MQKWRVGKKWDLEIPAKQSTAVYLEYIKHLLHALCYARCWEAGSEEDKPCLQWDCILEEDDYKQQKLSKVF